MSRRLRIFHFTTTGGGIGGTERLLVGIAHLADPKLWDLEFCTLTPRGVVNELVENHGWRTHALDVVGYPSLPLGLWRLREAVAAFRPDVVHVHLSHPAILGALAASLTPRCVLVQTRHYTDYVARFRRSRAPFDAWAARRCKTVIAVSDAARAQLVGSEGVADARVRVVENGVDWEDLSTLDYEDGRRRMDACGIPRGPTIGCAASFNIRKGHTYLLEAMVRVHARRPDVHLVLLGTGDNQSTARAAAKRLGIASHVHFLGHRDDANALMAGLDVYVQPSIEEGFGLAVIEAMAMRRPVVASAVGGMLDTVEEGQTGLRVPPARPDALAEAMLALLDDPERAATLGRRASERVRARYTLRRLLADYDDVYREALSDVRPSPPLSANQRELV